MFPRPAVLSVLLIILTSCSFIYTASEPGFVSLNPVGRVSFETSGRSFTWSVKTDSSWKVVLAGERFVFHNRDTEIDLSSLVPAAVEVSENRIRLEYRNSGMVFSIYCFVYPDTTLRALCLLGKISGGREFPTFHSDGHAENVHLGAPSMVDDFENGVVYIHRNRIRALALRSLGRFHYEDHYYQEEVQYNDNEGALWFGKVFVFAEGMHSARRAVAAADSLCAGKTPWQMLH